MTTKKSVIPEAEYSEAIRVVAHGCAVYESKDGNPDRKTVLLIWIPGLGYGKNPRPE